MNAPTSHLTVDYSNTTPHEDRDPRAAIARAMAAACQVADRLCADNASRPTPCDEWNALDVARHIVAVVDRATAGATGRSLDTLPELVDIDVDGLPNAMVEAAAEFHAAWADDAALTRSVDVPWGTFPGGAVLAVYTADLLVHTWDLAVAIGVDINWPESDVAAALEMGQAAFPDGPREGMPFDAVVRPAADAAPIVHLTGWVGRDTSRWSFSATTEEYLSWL